MEAQIPILLVNTSRIISLTLCVYILMISIRVLTLFKYDRRDKIYTLSQSIFGIIISTYWIIMSLKQCILLYPLNEFTIRNAYFLGILAMLIYLGISLNYKLNQISNIKGKGK